MLDLTPKLISASREIFVANGGLKKTLFIVTTYVEVHPHHMHYFFIAIFTSIQELIVESLITFASSGCHHEYKEDL